jgi:hypothetical protein
MPSICIRGYKTAFVFNQLPSEHRDIRLHRMHENPKKSPKNSR